MIKINWLDWEIEGKIYQRILFLGIGIIVIYLIVTFVSFAMPHRYKMSESTRFDTENSVKNGIMSLYKGKHRLEVSGWAYKQGQAVKTFNSSFVLKNEENEKMYQLKTGMQEIQELQFVDNLNCLNCGLKAQSFCVGMPSGVYHLYILYQNDGEDLLVDTSQKIEL